MINGCKKANENGCSKPKTSQAEYEGLIEDLHMLLQVFCDNAESDTCPMWVYHDKPCALRNVEDRMRELGMEVSE